MNNNNSNNSQNDSINQQNNRRHHQHQHHHNNNYHNGNQNNNNNNNSSNNSSSNRMNSSNSNNSISNNGSSVSTDTSLLNDSMTNASLLGHDGNYMPGTASLIDDVDKQLMVLLRDGRTFIGYLRSIDNYANLLLSSSFERIHVGNKYGDIPRGVFIVRGENVVLIGEVDFSLPQKVQMERVEPNVILELQKLEKAKQDELEKNKKKLLSERNGLMPSQSESLLDDFY